MSTLSILIVCGFVYLMFVTWMFRKKGNGNTSADKPPLPEKPKEENPPTMSGKKEDVPLVPKSDFDYERFQKAMTESMAAAFTYVLNTNPGLVKPEEVEFRESDDDKYDNEGDAAPSIDEIEPDTYSPPATGDTIEDIEAALNVAADSKATQEEKAKAGKVLSGMKDVVFIGKIMETNEKINDGIMACIAESMRVGQKKPKGSPSPKKKAKPLDVGGVLRDPDMIRRKKDDDEED